MGKGSVTQQKILDFIEKFTREHKYPPSVREIGAAVNLRSPSTVHMHLNTLTKRGLLQRDAKKTRAISIPGSSEKPRGVPILGKVTAGQPIFAFEEEWGTLPYRPSRNGEFFALEVRGDSMSKIGILDGDYVVVRKSPIARSGQVVVALLEEEATVKRLKREDGKIWLIPENDAYQPICGDQCHILGVVSSVVREGVY